MMATSRSASYEDHGMRRIRVSDIQMAWIKGQRNYAEDPIYALLKKRNTNGEKEGGRSFHHNSRLMITGTTGSVMEWRFQKGFRVISLEFIFLMVLIRNRENIRFRTDNSVLARSTIINANS